MKKSKEQIKRSKEFPKKESIRKEAVIFCDKAVNPAVQEKKSLFRRIGTWTMDHFFKTFIILAMINIFFIMSGRFIPITVALLAFLLLIIYIIIFLVKRIQKNIHKLVHHELGFSQILTVYITSAVFIVLLFSMMYWAMSAVGAGYLKYGNCTDNTDITRDTIIQDPLAVTNIIQYPYFSSITFFSVGFGDICPMGMSKIIAMINALIGNAFTVIILAIAITNYSASKNEEEMHREDYK
jgi:hypothetical protein